MNVHCTSTYGQRWVIGTGLAALWVLLAGTASAGEGHCAGCGCAAECRPVCRLVAQEKKIDVTCWGTKCEDYCLPGPSQRGCQHCEMVCDDDSATVCTQAKRFVWTEWIPGCGHLHTRKKLMKKTVTKKVPSFKWVVEDLCPQCEAKTAFAPPEVSLPDSVVPQTEVRPVQFQLGDGESEPARASLAR